MNIQNVVIGGIGNDFYNFCCFVCGCCMIVGCKRERFDFIIVICRFCLFFCYFYLGNFWMGIYNRRNVIVVNGCCMFGNNFSNYDIFFGGFVCQCRVVYDIIDGVYSWYIGCVVLVYKNKFMFIQVNFVVCREKIYCVRVAVYCNNEFIYYYGLIVF